VDETNSAIRARVGLVPWLATAGLVLLGISPAAAEDADHEIELLGAWHVTIHYRDDASENPDIERWDDRVWRFERRGSRLEWTEFPIVVFDDRSGRFESHDGERMQRVLHFWTPNEAQQAEIRKSLLVNPRGAKSKGLRGSQKRGYKSAGGLRAESASVIGYSESWYIEGLPKKPIFTRDDTMGSGSTENIEGRTRYTTETVDADGSLLRGTYVRDGTRHGTFTMQRVGEIVVIGSKRDTRDEQKKRKKKKDAESKW